MELIDTHAHLALEEISEPQEILERSRLGLFPLIDGKKVGTSEKNPVIRAIISPGISVETSRQVLELAESCRFLFPAVGIHPNYCAAVTEDDWKAIEDLALLSRVVAIGETGLDLYWDYTPIECQIDFFKRHLRLAYARNLPILIHCREAESELMSILRQVGRDLSTDFSECCLDDLNPTKNSEDSRILVPIYDEISSSNNSLSADRVLAKFVSSGCVSNCFASDNSVSECLTPEISAQNISVSKKDNSSEKSLRPLRGIIHSFSGDPEMAKECLQLGFHLSFSGSLTFTSHRFDFIREAAKIVPDNRLLIETDTPFLVPHPFRGKLERNEPLMCSFVARKLAELRGTSFEEIANLTVENARTLFRLP